MSKLNASASEWKPNIAAAEWKPTFGGATAATATAPTAGSAAPTPSSGGSLRLTASEFIPSSSIPSTATPSTAIATTPATTTPGAVPHVQPHQAAYGYYPYAANYYYDPYYVPMMYDPNLMMMQQPHQQYDGQHKSRSNSLTHQSEFTNSTAAIANGVSITTAASGKANSSSSKVETVANETNATAAAAPVASAAQSLENMKLDASAPATPSTTIASAPTETAESNEASVIESKCEPEGWQRGKALVVEVAEKQPQQMIEKVSLPDAGWQRGALMPEMTLVGMLGRQDGITRFSRESIITLHTLGVNTVPEELAALYGPRLTSNERSACKPLPSVTPKSPTKGGRRDGGGKQQRGHQDIIDEPHPDEKTIFQNKTDVFRYDPNRAVEISTSDRVITNAMMILNKLSVETFERLSDQFLNIGMETEEIMSRVVDLIVSKAQMEEHFCFMYADLCKKISEKWVSEDVDEGATGATTPAPNGEGGSSTVDLGKAFKTRLLIRCQEEFNQDREAAIQAVLELPIAEDDKEEKLFVLKKRYTGHMRFVGEIYMKDLLKPKNVYLSIEDLLVSHDEEKLSCLCKLLQTVGKKLEAYDLKKKKGKFAEYFQTIRQMSTDQTLSTKVRFGFKDLIEMRSNNWTARRVEEKAKKLSDIRGPDGVVAGTPTNQQQQQQQYQQQGGPGSGYGAGRGAPRVSHDVRNMPPPAAAGPAAGADEWSVVPDKKGKKAVPAGKMVAPGRGVAKPTAPSGLPISSNKFSALTSSSAPSSASRSGAKSSKGRFQEGDDEISKKDPRVSIPQSSDSQAPFSPNSESPAGGDAMSPMTAAAGEDGLLDETMTASIIATMNEYFLNDLLEEAIDVMKEKVHPNASGEAVRILIRAVLEKKDIDRKKFNIFLPALCSTGLVSKEQCVAGISSFLNDFDDIVVDVPLVADYVSSIIASLYLANAITDLSFALHLPDENNFSFSMNQFSLIVKTAVFIQRSSDEITAKKFFVSSLEGRSVSELGNMEKEQVERAIEKNQASFLV